MKRLIAALILVLSVPIPTKADSQAFVGAYVFLTIGHKQITESRFDPAFLIHGRVRNPFYGDIPRAWVVFATEESMVFDGLLQRFFEKRWYYKNFHPVELRRYTEAQAKQLYEKFHHFGPWY